LHLHQSYQFIICYSVANPVNDRINSSSCRNLCLLQSNCMGDNFNVVLVCFVNNCSQHIFIHAGHIGSGTITPAVSEDLDDVRPVGCHLLNSGDAFADRRDLLRVDFAASALSTVSTRCCHTSSKAHTWTNHRTAAHQATNRLVSLRIRT
jgi:hypothetical protein